MPNNYRELTIGVRNQLDPERLIMEKAIMDELASINYSDVLLYVRYAMNGVEEAYTQRSKDAGEFVKTHLTNGGITDASFYYQGSVMTNTHVKGYSDIDLLVITEKFYSFDAEQVSGILRDYTKQLNYSSTQLSKIQIEEQRPRYSGNALDDLKKLRTDSELILKQKYLICEYTKPKSINITNTNLKRNVDIVIANWFDDVTSIITDKGNNRGIQVYNKDLHQKGKHDFPLLSINRINEKSIITQGRLKKMIRFLKNLKGKSQLSIELTSFDFNAICYDIDQTKYQNKIFYELVGVVYEQLWSISSNQQKADDLKSVDGREYIFKGEPQKLQSVRNLLIEVEAIFNDLKINRVVL